MGFRLLWSCSALLLILATYNCPVSSQLVASQCIHNEEDFHTNNWIDYFTVLNWAQSGDDLPPNFVGKLVGQQEDVFYFDLAHANNGNPFLQNDFSWAGDAKHAYIYIRYYAHSENPNIEFYVVPDVAGAFFFMQPAVDFEWKEAFIETVPSSTEVEIGVFVSDFSTESYFFIDTIMFLQGNDRLYIEDARAICPPREPGKTSMATDLTTDSSTASGPTSDTTTPTSGTTASTSDSTESTSDSTASTTDSTEPTSESTASTSDSTGSTSDSTASTSDSTASSSDSTVSTSESTVYTSGSTASITEGSTGTSTDSTITTIFSSSISSDTSSPTSYSTSETTIDPSTSTSDESSEPADSSSTASSPLLPGTSIVSSSQTDGSTGTADASTSTSTPLPFIPPSISLGGLEWYLILIYSLIPLIALLVLLCAIYYYTRSRHQRRKNALANQQRFRSSPSNLSLHNFDVTVNDYSNNNHNVMIPIDAQGITRKNPLTVPSPNALSPTYSPYSSQYYPSLQVPDDYMRRESNISNRSNRSTYSGVRDPVLIIPRLIKN